MESNSVCNRTSDNKIGRPRSWSPICLSRVWLQTELDDTKSYYQLIINITISEKKKIAKLWKRGNSHLNIDKGGVNVLRLPAKTQKQARSRTRNYNFECDSRIELSDNCPTNKLSNKKLAEKNLSS